MTVCTNMQQAQGPERGRTLAFGMYLWWVGGSRSLQNSSGLAAASVRLRWFITMNRREQRSSRTPGAGGPGMSTKPPSLRYGASDAISACAQGISQTSLGERGSNDSQQAVRCSARDASGACARGRALLSSQDKRWESKLLSVRAQLLMSAQEVTNRKADTMMEPRSETCIYQAEEAAPEQQSHPGPLQLPQSTSVLPCSIAQEKEEARKESKATEVRSSTRLPGCLTRLHALLA